MLTKIVLSPKTNSRNCSRRKRNRTPKVDVAADVALVAVDLVDQRVVVDQSLVVVLADQRVAVDLVDQKVAVDQSLAAVLVVLVVLVVQTEASLVAEVLAIVDPANVDPELSSQGLYFQSFWLKF